jgi:DNA primase
MVWSSPTEEIKQRLDIVDVVGGYVKLQKAGVNWRARCPFHAEKSPSFFVSPTRQTWHCFGGCGEGGDMFSFVMKLEGVEFGDALRQLAQQAGVELQARDPSYKKIQSERARLYEVLELAAKFFERQLRGGAFDYLVKRGLTQESITAWRLGYAPENTQHVFDFLRQQGYSQEEIRKAGLTGQFRSRLIFPVCDMNSQVIGFGGRVFGEAPEGTPKYLNTANTLVYDKSRVLYGLDKAKLAARKQNSCVLVEGYMDAIMVSQAGCEQVAATSGTALTAPQLQILKRYADNLVFAFDMDVAGDSATKRGVDLALGAGFAITIARMPNDMDPADVAAQGGEAWANILQGAETIFDYSFKSALARFDKHTPEGKKAISNMILPVIKNIPHKIEQSHWVSRLADELDTKEEFVYEELGKTRTEQARSSEIERVKARGIKPRRELLEEHLLVLVFAKPANAHEVRKDIFDSLSLPVQQAIERIRKVPDYVPEFAQHLALLADEQEIEDVDAELHECMAQMYTLSAREKLDMLAHAIKRAEQESDTARAEGLLREFHTITHTHYGAEKS